jgi:3-hydroxybutyryl-CoA dehydrogenase
VSVARVGIVGAGFMGSGIAESAARAGVDVTLHEPEEAPLDRSKGRIEQSVARAVKGGKLTDNDAAQLLGRVAWTRSFDDLGGCDLVVEAVVEDARVKGEVFKRLDALLPDAILASNTSSIPIAQLASWTQRPERVLGLHFFSPVPVMKLVEIVVALDTADDTIAKGEAFVTQIGKRPIRTKDRSGFIVNMLLVPYLMAAVRMFVAGHLGRKAGRGFYEYA